MPGRKNSSSMQCSPQSKAACDSIKLQSQDKGAVVPETNAFQFVSKG